jgi:hypothetical protein
MDAKFVLVEALGGGEEAAELRAKAQAVRDAAEKAQEARDAINHDDDMY